MCILLHNSLPLTRRINDQLAYTVGRCVLRYYVSSMATESAPTTTTCEKALRERIHRLFCGDGPSVTPPTAPPSFWVGPTEKQKNAVSLDVPEPITLSDGIEIEAHAEAEAVKRRWLNSPHVDLGGKSPEEMLTGGERSRQSLCTFVAAIEAVVGSGSFS